MKETLREYLTELQDRQNMEEIESEEEKAKHAAAKQKMFDATKFDPEAADPDAIRDEPEHESSKGEETE